MTASGRKQPVGLSNFSVFEWLVLAKAVDFRQQSGGGVARARAGVQNGFCLRVHFATRL